MLASGGWSVLNWAPGRCALPPPGSLLLDFLGPSAAASLTRDLRPDLCLLGPVLQSAPPSGVHSGGSRLLLIFDESCCTSRGQARVAQGLVRLGVML